MSKYYFVTKKGVLLKPEFQDAIYCGSTYREWKPGDVLPTVGGAAPKLTFKGLGAKRFNGVVGVDWANRPFEGAVIDTLVITMSSTLAKDSFVGLKASNLVVGGTTSNSDAKDALISALSESLDVAHTIYVATELLAFVRGALGSINHPATVLDLSARLGDNHFYDISEQGELVLSSDFSHALKSGAQVVDGDIVLWSPGDKLPAPPTQIISEFGVRKLFMMLSFHADCSKVNLQDWDLGLTDLTRMFFYSSVREVVFPAVAYGSMKATFLGCAHLVKVTLPEGVSELYQTFSDCKSMVMAPVLPASVLSAEGAFYGCSSLREMPVFHDGVLYLRDCFRGCCKLAALSPLPKSVIDYDGIFDNCDEIGAAIVGVLINPQRLMVGNFELEGNGYE